MFEEMSLIHPNSCITIALVRGRLAKMAAASQIIISMKSKIANDRID
jgi:hypothetical protein